MAIITLSSPFSVLDEGRYVFKITKVEYKEKFGKLSLTLETEDGKKHIERYNLVKGNGEPNSGALAAFSYFAKAALNDFDLDEIDHEELLGCFIEATVEHDVRESTKKEGETVTFVNLKDVEASDGWEQSKPKAKAQPKKENTSGIDLDSLLG